MKYVSSVVSIYNRISETSALVLWLFYIFTDSIILHY